MNILPAPIRLVNLAFWEGGETGLPDTGEGWSCSIIRVAEGL
jgi:hypothetical protein